MPTYNKSSPTVRLTISKASVCVKGLDISRELEPFRKKACVACCGGAWHAVPALVKYRQKQKSRV